MAKLTVAWDRAENAAYLPRDSSEVTVTPKLTVAWGPMLQQSVLDWDPADLVITPGAGVPAVPTTPTTPTTPADTTTTATTPPAVTVPGATVTVPAAGGGVPAPAPGGGTTAPGTPGAPDVRVASRRTAGLFRKEGLLVEVIAPADAGVRAVLVASVPRRGANGKLTTVERKLSGSRLVHVQAGERERFHLKISAQGRRAIAELDRIEATLQVAVSYGGKAKTLRLTRKVVLVKAKTKKG